MERVLLDEVVMTSYGQLDLVWAEGAGFDGDWSSVFAGQTNGLVGAANPGGVYVNLARYGGGSRVRVVLLDAEPAEPDEYFEDVVEVSTAIPAGADVQWQAWAGMGFGTIEGLSAGTYRVRVSAHGRDAGHQGEFADGVVDEYLIEWWPSPAKEDAILRVGSANAEYWHGYNGKRPSAG
jgi:hypothetical protein